MIKRLAVLVACLVISVESQATCNKPIKQQLAAYVNSDDFQTYQQRNGIDPARMMIFAVYDHRALSSTALTFYRFDRHRRPGRPGVRRPATDTPETPATESSFVEFTPRLAAGVPQLPVNANTPVIFTVVNTNPLLYDVDTTMEKTEIAAAADLRTIVGGIGGTISSILAAAANREAMQVRAAPGAPVSDLWIPVPAELETLQKAAADVETLASNADTLKQRVVDYLTLAEHETDMAGLSKRKVASSEFMGQVVRAIDAFDKLQRSVDAFGATPFAKAYSCAALQPIANEAAALDWTAANTDLAEDVQELDADARATSCPAATIAHFLTILDASQGARHGRLFKQYSRLVDVTGAVLTDARATLAKRPTLMQAANALQTFGSALRAASPTDEPCDIVAGMVVADADSVDITSQGVVTATISETSPLGGTYARRAPETPSVKYRIANRIADQIGVAVGVVHTTVNDATYKAVTNPADTTTKVISKTSRENRSGDLALFATLRLGNPANSVRPGLQLGAGIGESARLFGGVAIDLGRYVRFGVGATAQKVRELAEGQRFLRFTRPGVVDPASLTIVAEDADIRYRDRHTVRPYASLSISIDGLAFWQRQ